ncbi:cystatin-like [Melanotaenia boesemani]|uniref:cystatin-like n=1 Tax=Melanotaenia boesemani TaxID=1250792 RepID=UPI001C03ABFC|nr:cystatin-like [Melanotaenia boesemani]
MFVWFWFFVCVVATCRFLTAKHVMIGQPHKVPVNSPGVLKAARFAVVDFNRANIDEVFAYKIMNVTSAKMQIVAGINYILDVQLGRTVCKRRDTDDSEPCALHSEHKECHCHFIVTEIPWENLCVLTENKCQRD